MYELKKNGKLFTSKFFGTGPSSCEKRIYRAAVPHRLRNTEINGRLYGFLFLSKPRDFFPRSPEALSKCLLMAISKK